MVLIVAGKLVVDIYFLMILNSELHNNLTSLINIIKNFT